jgi:hypothetical protein
MVLTEKRCDACAYILPIEKFYTYPKGARNASKSGYRGSCKKCWQRNVYRKKVRRDKGLLNLRIPSHFDLIADKVLSHIIEGMIAGLFTSWPLQRRGAAIPSKKGLTYRTTKDTAFLKARTHKGDREWDLSLTLPKDIVDTLHELGFDIPFEGIRPPKEEDS